MSVTRRSFLSVLLGGIVAAIGRSPARSAESSGPVVEGSLPSSGDVVLMPPVVGVDPAIGPSHTGVSLQWSRDGVHFEDGLEEARYVRMVGHNVGKSELIAQRLAHLMRQEWEELGREHSKRRTVFIGLGQPDPPGGIYVRTRAPKPTDRNRRNRSK